VSDQNSLEAGDARVVLDPERGGRLASLRVDGLELLVQPDERSDPMRWGCYPMVPWAGRVREGRFRFRGETYELPLDAPPHAIHGVGYRRAWRVEGPGRLSLDLDGGWPFGGRADHDVALTPEALTLTMTVTAGDRAMPVMAGWHPCFRPVLERGTRAELHLPATCIWERDETGIPSGRTVPVPDHPWDDCFGGFRGDPTITWPGAVALTMRSSCPTWVVYDEDPRLVCVEPQTDAPDAFNRDPAVLEPGDRLRVEFVLEWSR